ncbi:hypothetical protein [Clostridioides difficile]|nr:hypothetical protein [Clostridioides difficile]NKN22660.1 hypothetical protein [Clostridioides difficile]
MAEWRERGSIKEVGIAESRCEKEETGGKGYLCFQRCVYETEIKSSPSS